MFNRLLHRDESIANTDEHTSVKNKNIFIEPLPNRNAICKTNCMKLLLTLIFLVYLSANAQNNQDLATLSTNKTWSKLLHNYDIEDNNFYLSGSKKNSPLVELKANIEALKSNPKYNCLFPARAKLLSSALQISYTECPGLVEWKKKVSGDTLSLIYVSQYVSNPASAFGHTFLLFKKKNSPLNLNMIISNAANMPDDVSNFDYLVKGLLGGFPAEFSNDFLYLKIQEYSNIENRDMWIYDLKFSPEQIDQVLNHIWELSHQVSLPYQFLNKNCAVYSYNVLAAVHPDLEFLPSAIYVMPVETVVKIFPYTSQIDYSPSLREKMFLRSQLMTSEELSEFKKSITPNEPFTPTMNVEISELILENYELLRTKQDGKLSASQNENHQKALLNRAQLGQKIKPVEIPRPQAPHTTLPPRRIALFAGHQNQESFYFFSASPIYHSLLESSAGYLPFSEFIVLETEVQKISDRPKAKVTLIQAANFPLSTVFDSQWSWKIRSQFRSHDSCENCWGHSGEFDIGKSFDLYKHSRLFALLGTYQDRKTELSPQILFGGLSETTIGNTLYQIRNIKELNDNKIRTLLELGFNFSINAKTNLELLANLEDKDPSYQTSLSYHF